MYTKGHILGIDGNKVTVETSNDIKSQELILPAVECYHPHPGDDVPDHCQLMFLSQPTMLENTRKRFAKGRIYTLVGDILIAVNPFKWIDDIYGGAVRALSLSLSLSLRSRPPPLLPRGGLSRALSVPARGACR